MKPENSVGSYLILKGAAPFDFRPRIKRPHGTGIHTFFFRADQYRRPSLTCRGYEV